MGYNVCAMNKKLLIPACCFLLCSAALAGGPAERAAGAEEAPTRAELESANESLETVRRVCHDCLASILAELRATYPGINARQSQGRSKRNDYRNYQWISIKADGREYLITIHHNNIDLRTGNPHTQYGRVQFWRCAGPNGPHTRENGEWRFRYDNAWLKMPRIRVWDEDYSAKRVVELFGEYMGEEGVAFQCPAMSNNVQQCAVMPTNVQQCSAITNVNAIAVGDPPLAERRKVDEALENLRAVEAKAMASIVREARARHPEWAIRPSRGNSKVNDYRNYQWITIRVGDEAYWISMVYNDLDEQTGNTHTQYGRIQFWRGIGHQNGERNEAGPHTKENGVWRFRADKQWKDMPRLHLWDENYSPKRVIDLFEEFLAARD